jgi:hypothetical protein
MLTVEDRARQIVATLSENPPTSWGALNPVLYVVNHLKAAEAIRVKITLANGNGSIEYSAKSVEECLDLRKSSEKSEPPLTD